MAPTVRPEWTLVDFIHRGPWWRHSGILALNICLVLPLLTAWSNGLDSSLINGLQLLPAWQNYFNNPDGKVLGLLNSSQNIGSLIGLPFTPFVSDHWGRKTTLFIGAIIMIAGAAVQSTAKTVIVFIAARVVLGIGLTFSLASAPLLITELAYPTQRGKLSSFYNVCWYFGSIANAWTVFAVYNHLDGEWTWRIPTIVQVGAPVLQLCLIWFIPESPRFLMHKGLESRAAAVLARYHAHGDERDPLVVFELAQIRHAIRSERAATNGQSWSVLWGTTGNRKRMVIIIALAVFSQWSGNGLVSYYINLVLESVGINDTRTKAGINGGLQIWNLCCAMTGALLVDKLGRRTLFLISNIGMLIVFCCWTITVALVANLNLASAGKATIPLLFLFYFFYDIAYTPLLVAYSLEILPFHIRAKGFTVLNLTVALTIAFNQFVNPWALDGIGWWYYLVYIGFLCFELFFVWKYIIETKGRTLEETAALFDGEPVELMEEGVEAATQLSHRVRIAPIITVTTESDQYYSEEMEAKETGLVSEPSPLSGHKRVPFEHIEMSSLDDANLPSTRERKRNSLV